MRVWAGTNAKLGSEEPVAPLLSEVEELSSVVAPMVATGEETGSQDLMLRKAAEFMEAEALYVLERGVEAAG